MTAAMTALGESRHQGTGERTQLVDSMRGDYPRRIDASTMIAAPLTKAMAGDRMMAALGTGVLDLQPTPESLATKARNRGSRRKAKKAAK